MTVSLLEQRGSVGLRPVVRPNALSNDTDEAGIA